MSSKSKKSDVKAAAANDVNLINNDDQAVKAQAITDAQKLVDDLKDQLSKAKDELRKLTGKKPSEPKGPGVILTILSLVEKSGKSGISKQEIVDKLAEMFPDHNPEGLMKTVQVQLPKRMSKERNVNIIKSEAGKFLIK